MLSKILVYSRLSGQLWIKDSAWQSHGMCPRTWSADFVLIFLDWTRFMPALLQPCIHFPKRVAPKLTTFCANFSRLSELLFAVNIFFAFLEIFYFKSSQSQNPKIRTAQNLKIPERPKWPRSTQLLNFISTAVAWVWIAGRPLGSQPRSNTWTALRLTSLTSCSFQNRGAKLPYLTRVPRFLLPCKRGISLRLFEIISASSSLQLSAAKNLVNNYPCLWNPPPFLSKQRPFPVQFYLLRHPFQVHAATNYTPPCFPLLHPGSAGLKFSAWNPPKSRSSQTA
jgi:hypothetical protein